MQFTLRVAQVGFQDLIQKLFPNTKKPRAIDLNCPMNKSQNHPIKVVGSINGLISLAIEEKDLFLWNPSVSKLKNSLTGRFTSYGFGYDELYDDYKVVGITKYLCYDDSRYNVGKVYSLNNNSWKRLDDFQIVIQFPRSGVFVNGKLHWTNTAKRFGYHNDWDIIFVDLADGR
ncbi:F-box/kelch-repeat protein At3g23880-like [Capsicum annuum]|nr:F-box/kelch-repeat protein At3g23880-like [Capsicum annuum]